MYVDVVYVWSYYDQTYTTSTITKGHISDDDDDDNDDDN